MLPVRQKNGGVLIDISVVPNSKKEGIFVEGDTIRVRVKAPADKGKANKEVIKRLSKLFGACEMVSGASSRKKTVFVDGATIHDALRAIESIS